SYHITDKIVFNWTCDYRDAKFYATDAAATNICVEISTGNGADPTDAFSAYNAGTWFRLPDLYNAEKVNDGGWAGLGIGYRYVNVNTAQIVEGVVSGFGTGVQQLGNGRGCAYNTVQCGFMRNNKVGRHITTTALAGSYVNRWDYIGGRYFISAAEAGYPEIAGTRFLQVDTGAAHLINDHNFYGGSWEGDGPEYHMWLGGTYIQ